MQHHSSGVSLHCTMARSESSDEQDEEPEEEEEEAESRGAAEVLVWLPISTGRAARGSSKVAEEHRSGHVMVNDEEPIAVAALATLRMTPSLICRAEANRSAA